MPGTEFDCSANIVALPAVPVLDAPTPRGLFTLLMPVVMLAGTVGFLVIGGGGTTSLLMGGLMAVSLIGMIVSGGGRSTQPAAAVAADRERFLRRLDCARTDVAARESVIRATAHRRHPPPRALQAAGCAITDAAGPLTLRVGVGAVPAVVRSQVTDPEDAHASLEPFAELALRSFVRAHAVTADMPLTIDLHPGRPLLLIGDGAADLARSLILQCAGVSPPDRCPVVLLAPDDAAGWDWLKWLPHHGVFDDSGTLRSSDVPECRRWLRRFHEHGENRSASVLVVTVSQPAAVLDALAAESDPGHPVRILGLPGSAVDGRRGDLVLSVEGAALCHRRHGREVPWGTPDRVGEAQARALARRMLSRMTRPGSAAERGSGAPSTTLADLLAVGAAADYRPALHQRNGPAAARLRVPIGVGAAGAAVHLDLKEAAQGGMGPHGLLIGATGSGKSELLRTVVLGLAATHSPRVLNFVLIDFKGGAGFLPLGRLPHVAAVITNLAEQAVQVARMRDALAGELNRRQELLHRAGDVASATEYEQARRLSPELPELPALLVVCDEFTELLTQHPDLAETFVMLGRLGRSLGVHLLMASQRIEEGRMRGLDAHLSYRIALKTFSAADSRAVLDVDVAYRLSSAPGAGYLKTGAGEPLAFTAAYVSGPVPAVAGPAADLSRSAATDGIRLFPALAPRSRSAPDGPVPGGVPTVPAAGPSPTLIDLWVGRLEGHGGSAHPIWLPPLGVAPVLDALGRTAAASIRRLRVPVGIVDRPYDQRHDVLWADFNGSAGHALVVGGPRSGKSTLLASLVLALALTHSPTDLHCYIVDAGGGSLTALADVPQVGGVARRDDAPRVRRMLAQLTAELAAREVAGDGDGAGAGAGRTMPELFLVIDGWTAFRAAFDDLEPAVAALVQRGLAYGIHVIMSASRWPEVRPAMKDLMGLRFELRLGDPAESEVDRRRAAEVPDGAPGRGLTRDGFHLLVATPGSADAPGSAARSVADRRRRWPGDGAPPVRLLPPVVTPDALRQRAADLRSGVVPLGLGESDLQVVAADFEAESHIVVWGDSGSGKTSFLRTLAAAIADRRSPTEARFLVVDQRRTMLGEVPAAHLAGHATSAAATAGLVAEAVELLTGRLDDGDAGAVRPRDRRWTGAELFVLVDDYDLVAAGAPNPLSPLLELLPHARDIGLHLIVCRRAAGGARALWDPLLQQLRELGAAGLILSGSPDEGALHGSQRAVRQPPGRGFWITRTSTELVQLARTPT